MDAGGKKGGVKSDINVTPLVDIVLVLLIIFIVITPAVNDSVKLPLAKHSPKVVKQPGAHYMTLYFGATHDADGKYVKPGFVTTDDPAGKDLKVDLSNDAQSLALAKLITASVGALDDKRVFVKADADLPYKNVNELFQLARKAGADEASIVTSEKKKDDKEGGN